MIIPSKQVLLISAAEKKQVFMFDPKTACVLQTYTSQSGLASTAGYFQQGHQFLIPHLNNAFINVWDIDAQQPRKFSVGEGDRITYLTLIQGNILLLGSSHGMLYIYQLPSGILIKKVQLHSQSNEIRHIIYLNETGYFITATKKQIKLWTLRDILVQNHKTIAQRTITSVLQIINISLIRGILCVVTQKSLQFYYACNFSLFTLNRDQPQANNVTCSCSSKGSLYLGDALGKIRQISVDAHDKQLLFQQRKGKILLQNKKGVQIQTKDPISVLAYIQSLQYLISGNCKGQIKIWHGRTLKNSVQLFKSSITLLSVIPRINKQNKIPQSHKIKSLHKQQQTKVDQPIIYDSGNSYQLQNNEINELSFDIYLERMLNYLNDPSQQLNSEIQAIRKQNKELLQANMQYFAMLDQQNEQNYEKRSYK